MFSRWIMAVTSCLIILSGCGIGRTTVRPEIYGQFEVVGPIIRDTVTGLEWQMGPDHDISWDDAKSWVEGLEGNWRMPARSELLGLWSAGISMDDWGPFENSGRWAWSGELRDSTTAWSLTFLLGAEDWYYRSSALNSRVFAVRSP